MTAADGVASRPKRSRSRHDSGPASAGPPGLGTALLIAGAAVLVLRGLQDAGGFDLSLPSFWYSNRALWYAIGLAFCGGGIAILRERPPGRVRWKPSKPGVRFRQLVVYSRDDCPLCEEAIETLLDYRQWMPRAEVENIDLDPALQERFHETVPVVQIDGRIRFRGRVNEVLLRRLIEGTAPIDSGMPPRHL